MSRLEIEQARSELSKVTDTINMVRTEGLDASTVELLLSRKKYELQSLMAWQGGECGPHCVAINAKVYDARKADVEGFLGRQIWKDNHRFGFEGESYEIFSFREKADADRFMTTFSGEPFDYRDAGSGKNWMKWYKGRAANREKNRSPYDFRK